MKRKIKIYSKIEKEKRKESKKGNERKTKQSNENKGELFFLKKP